MKKSQLKNLLLNLLDQHFDSVSDQDRKNVAKLRAQIEILLR